MKKLLFILGGIILVSPSGNAALHCPAAAVIEANIASFVNNTQRKDDFKKATITLDGRTWDFDSDLKSPDIRRGETKSLNREMSDIDEHTCNYIVYPMDSNEEDVTITLTIAGMVP